MNIRDAYVEFIRAGNADGSNRASSYIRALDLLGPILKRKRPTELRAENIWSITSPEHVQELYKLVLLHQRLGDEGFFKNEKPISYWRDGFCSAALKSYKTFLVTYRYEEQMWNTYNDTSISKEEIGDRLADVEVESAEVLLEDINISLKDRQGLDAVREIKTRIGQGFFRKMILRQYSNQCCITGLNVPEVLRASHITSWAEDYDNRMNPSNGLCLSATYDAAFDRHLISFDDDCRMILSPVLKDYYTNEAFKANFLKREGVALSNPCTHAPDMKLLEKHREVMFSR
jgi:putative restriction endonuclease